jgi:excisionase family DNA binding protein
MVILNSPGSGVEARRDPKPPATPDWPTPRRRGGPRGGESTKLPVLVDITEIADHLGVSVRHVRRLVAERRIPYVKWGNLLRFDPSEIARWLDDKVIAPPGSRRC